MRDRVFSNEVDYETCTNVHAAAELLRNHYYDLLILDILLPCVKGESLLVTAESDYYAR